MVLCMVLQRGVTANQISQCSSICQSRPDCSAIRPELYIFQMSDSHFSASAAYSRHMQTAINQVLKDIFIYHNTLILYEKIVLYHILAETGGKTDSCSGPFFIVLMIRQGATLSASHIEKKTVFRHATKYLFIHSPAVPDQILRRRTEKPRPPRIIRIADAGSGICDVLILT